VWLNSLTNSEWFFLRNLFRNKLMNILTILIRNLIKMVIGSILARFLGNIITLVIRYIFTLIIGDLVTFLVGFLDGSVFWNFCAKTFFQVFAGFYIVNPDFVVTSSKRFVGIRTLPMLVTNCNVFINALILNIGFLDFLVGLIAIISVFCFADIFVLNWTDLFLVWSANCLVFDLGYLSVFFGTLLFYDVFFNNVIDSFVLDFTAFS